MFEAIKRWWSDRKEKATAARRSRDERDRLDDILRPWESNIPHGRIGVFLAVNKSEDPQGVNHLSIYMNYGTMSPISKEDILAVCDFYVVDISRNYQNVERITDRNQIEYLATALLKGNHFRTAPSYRL